MCKPQINRLNKCDYLVQLDEYTWKKVQYKTMLPHLCWCKLTLQEIEFNLEQLMKCVWYPNRRNGWNCTDKITNLLPFGVSIINQSSVIEPNCEITELDIETRFTRFSAYLHSYYCSNANEILPTLLNEI